MGSVIIIKEFFVEKFFIKIDFCQKEKPYKLFCEKNTFKIFFLCQQILDDQKTLFLAQEILLEVR